jgi:hypothetical protein
VHSVQLLHAVRMLAVPPRICNTSASCCVVWVTHALEWNVLGYSAMLQMIVRN